ncbi:hypothetical protein K437DRAFT_255092 [Tilletiaria anomala UBC 951]|uniref:BTB domain-containing protein n=1 Tax=Tilletiaria anomala (strain ATCC 24038 / CBS 436.72 / UBC 951) TaxID=1037660 RepID=A0A066WI94_TILAU|nr:uncharacterized protein K437DRAFT_255092 [Tilletiaria anomala UBC 951]KDN50385.1 hypothetical protein K437DRAFT_255092 [Tilletiaria anomala UBC 951]
MDLNFGTSPASRHHHHSRGSHGSNVASSSAGAALAHSNSLLIGSSSSAAGPSDSITAAVAGGSGGGSASNAEQIISAGTSTSVHPALAAAAAGHSHGQGTVLGGAASGHSAAATTNSNMTPSVSLHLPGTTNVADMSSFSIHGGSPLPVLGLPVSPSGPGGATSAGVGPSALTAAYTPSNSDPTAHAHHRTHLASLSFMSHMSKALHQGGMCSDVIIAAFGRHYKLHKIVLVQAGFFNTMFCGGFSEAEEATYGIELAQPSLTDKASHGGAHRFDVHFPDPNMSRPAFEFCIATLYGCAPTLKLPGWANPKADTPLGEAFPNTIGRGSTNNKAHANDASASTCRSSSTIGALGGYARRGESKDNTKQKGKKAKGTHGHKASAFDVSFTSSLRAGDTGLLGQGQVPTSPQFPADNTQWATPRFLLSLIATSTYLGVPSVTSLALTLILGSISPYTVSAYLRFASGLGIVSPSHLQVVEGHSRDVSNSLIDELEGPLIGWERLSAASAPYPATRHAMRSPQQVQMQNHRVRSPPLSLSSPRQEPQCSAAAEPSGCCATGSISLVADRWDGQQVHTSTDINWGAPSEDNEMSRSPMGKSSPAPQIPPQLPDNHHQEATADAVHSIGNGADWMKEDVSTDLPHTAQLFYGPSCNKIGEACVSWLCRWGGDVLDWEINIREGAGTDTATDDEYMSLGSSRRSENVLGKDEASEDALSEDSDEQYLPHKLATIRVTPSETLAHPSLPTPVIWAYSRAHGLPSDIVREVISSDSFFVKSEWARYTLARDIVEFRRRGKETGADDDETEMDDSASLDDHDADTQSLERNSADHSGSLPKGFKDRRATPTGKSTGETPRTSPRGQQAETISSLRRPSDSNEEMGLERTRCSDLDSDETEYSELFSRGIYYTHMSFSELSAIAEDVSPSTGSLYVPEQVLQKALWAGMEFRNIILQSNDREVDSSQLGDDPDRLLMTGLTLKEDALCDLYLANDLDAFRQDFFAGTSFSDSPSKSWRSLKRENTPSTPGSPSNKLAKRRPSTMNLSMRSDLLSSNHLSKKSVADKRFFPVPSDDTLRLGDGLGSLITATLQVREGLTGYTHDAHGALTDTAASAIGASGLAGLKDPYTLSVPASRRSLMFPGQSHPASGQKPLANYFGIADYSRTGKELAEKSAAASATAAENAASESFRATPFSLEDHLQSGGDSKGDGVTDAREDETPGVHREMWLPFEPMRIGVDFWGVDKLAERNRLYSPTFFYAGSLWNLYVQTMRKPKGIQLGIYLHRQNPADALPPASAEPSEAAGASSSTRVNAPSLDQLLNESLNLAPAGLHSDTIGGSTPRGPRVSTYGSSLNPGGAAQQPDEQPPTVPATMPAMPYRDPRKGIRAFFSIHCPSPFGNALTRFSSGPDQFTLSQSWGWKSSSLLGTVYLADGHIEDVRSESANRFRCVCTIGLI